MPRYFKLAFSIKRVQRASTPQKHDPHKTHQQTRACELRQQGFSYPEIAHELGVSVGKAWNYANKG